MGIKDNNILDNPAEVFEYPHYFLGKKTPNPTFPRGERGF
jgi:hypothetical protein